MLTTWLAWWIGADGLGMGGYANGINVIVLTNILAAGPRSLLFLLEAGALRFALVLLALALLALPVLIVQGASRRVPVQYARRVTPRRTMMHSPHSYIPFPVVPGGLDAIEMVYAIATVGALAMQVIRTWVPALAAPLESLSAVTATAPPGLPLREVMGALGMFLGVVLMTMLQASTNFEEADYARDLQRAGGMIPNVRSGEPTRNYLARIVGRLSLAGAVIMGLFSILPWLLQWALGLPQPVYMAWAVWTICRILTDYIKGIEAELSMYGYRDDILIK
jgi:preprotein translocase subunit SecY